jgi:hypothetical protein
MPFRSKSQQRFMFSVHPAMAKTWAKHTLDIKALPERVKKPGEKQADGAGWDPNLSIFKPMPGQPVPGQAPPAQGGFPTGAQPGVSARAPSAPAPAQGTGSPLDRYGPARRRPHLTDPLTVGGALPMDDGTMKTGSGSVRGDARGDMADRVRAEMRVGRGKKAAVSTDRHAPAAAAGNRNLGLLKAAMGAFEAAWSKDAVADMSPAPTTAFTTQGARPPASTTFSLGAQPPPPVKGPVQDERRMGTAPHMQNLAARQGKPTAPQVPLVQAL